MALRLIIGRAGSGKTHLCLEEIRRELRQDPQGEPLIFLVPDQATFQMERALAATPGLGGIIRAQVLSFGRLAWRVLQEVGGASRRPMGEVGRQMVLRQILQSNSGQLAAFRKSAQQPGFIDCLSQTVSELKKYRLPPQQLQALADRLEQAGGDLQLGRKLRDICLIAGAFDDFLVGDYSDPEDTLTTLADRLAAWPPLGRIRIWLDGFAGFTPQEYLILERLLAGGAQLNLALCLDRETMTGMPDREDIFYSLWETGQKLKNMAEDLAIPVLPTLYLEEQHRFPPRGALAHLEKQLTVAAPRAYPADCPEVILVAAASRRAEVEGAAREIVGLCRDQGYRWREISVTVREMPLYSELLAAVFADYGIPCFIDEKRPVLHHPLVEMVRSALEAADSNWAYEPVFRFLKTDLTALGRDAVDCLENYVLAHGLRGSRWTDGRPWAYRRRYTLGEEEALSLQEETELARINQLRLEVCRTLEPFCRQLKEAKTVRQMAAAVFSLVEGSGAAERLDRWQREDTSAGRLELAAENRQVWDAFLDLLDQMVETLGDQAMSTAHFSQVMEAGCAGIRLGLIPPGLDQVFVAALDRSRQPDVRACLVLGVNDGVLPARMQDQGVFDRGDRERLAELDCVLAATSRQRLFDEQFLAYVAMTRASQRLYVSYALADEEGKALRPSFLIRQIRGLLPQLAETLCPQVPDGLDDLRFIAGPGQSRFYLAGQLRRAADGERVHELWWDVHNLSPGLFTRALSYTNQVAQLPAGLASKVFGHHLATSVSRLERFRACPFAHFAQFGLKLRERQEYALAAPDLGQFFHAALEGVTARLAVEGRDWADLGEDDCRRLAAESAAGLVPKLQHEILLSTAGNRHLAHKLTATLTACLGAMAEHARRGSFRPERWETAFGLEGPLPAWQTTTEAGRTVSLSGRIDRIDTVRAGETLFLRVVDYKSGRADWDLNDIYWGLKMQLLVYLLVALENAPALFGQAAAAAGALYFRVHYPLLRQTGPLSGQEAAALFLRQYRMPGLVLADPQVVRLMDREFSGFSPLVNIALKRDGSLDSRAPGVLPQQFRLLMAHLQGLIRQTGDGIMAGQVMIAPYQKGNVKACLYCAFKPFCHFDTLLPDNRWRRLAAEKADQLWHKMGGESGGDTR